MAGRVSEAQSVTPTSRSLLLDSSVVVKWFRNEVDSDKALAIQSESLRGKLDVQIADLTYYETANALRYSGEFTSDQVCECLESIVTLGVGAYALDLDILKSAVEGSFEKGISIYDAYLIALANGYGLAFVTADAKLFAGVKGDDSVLLLSGWPG